MKELKNLLWFIVLCAILFFIITVSVIAYNIYNSETGLSDPFSPYINSQEGGD